MRFKNFSLALLCLIVVSMGIIGCGGGSSNGGNKLSPPTWIQGTWVSDSKVYKFSFTGNSVIEYTGNNATTHPSTSVPGIKYKEIKGSSTYEFTINYTNDNTITYSFKSINATQITYDTGYDLITLNKQ